MRRGRDDGHVDEWPGYAARVLDQVDDSAVEALWRALNHLCAAQLYLRDNVRLDRSIVSADVKPRPAGHWGVGPPVNLVLASLAALQRPATNRDMWFVHGAGHAGPSALAYAYLTGRLGERWPRFRQSAQGLRRLVAEFPHPDTLGGEITALLPGQRYMGGQLGPALAHATGAVLDAPHRLVVCLVGDGECETGAASAAWLGARALRRSGRHGFVLPVVLLNGLRMGGVSLLGGMAATEVMALFRGLGYRPLRAGATGVSELRRVLREAVTTLVAVGAQDCPPVVLVDLPKGATGPEAVGGARILGTPSVHKTPLADPAADPVELAALDAWLRAYRPGELLTASGAPTAMVARALPPVDGAAATSARPGAIAMRKDGVVTGGPRGPETGSPVTAPPSFGEVVARHVRARGATGGYRLFSPDELRSNRIRLEIDGELPTWATEVLNEELCHLWLQGYLESGRRGIFVSYEGFAPVNTSLVSQYLKHRSVARAAGVPSTPAMTYLLTSLAWQNCFSHQNPGLLSAVVECEDPTVRVYTPSDPARLAAVLERTATDVDRFNLVVSGKHAAVRGPSGPIVAELTEGAAIWPDHSDLGVPDVVVAAAGDTAVRQVSAALRTLAPLRADVRVRFVNVMELTCLGDPQRRPHALSDAAFASLFGVTTPVVLLVPGYVGAVRGLLWGRRDTGRRITVLGYRDPGRPASPDTLLNVAGIDADSLASLIHRTAWHPTSEEVDVVPS